MPLHDSETPEVPSLSRKEAIVLGLLLNGAEQYGLEMVEASNGELKRGTIYVTLQRMEEKGFISSRKESRVFPEIGIPRRLYVVTGLGKRVMAAAHAAQAVLVPQFT
jgi:PadR family transcriptional regulator PadR